MSMNKDVLHLDEAGSLFFTKQLEYVKTRVIEEKLQELDYAKFLPVSSEMPLGASTFTWRSYKGYGQARMISDYSRDFPRVAVGATENTVKPKEIGASYGYSLMEIRRAQYANVNLDTRLATAARRAIEQKINQLAWTGDANYNIQGFIKYPGTLEYTVPGALPADKLWVNKTADEILTDLNGLIFASYNATNGIEMADTLLLPPAQLQLIRNKRLGTDSDVTVYEFFTRNNPGIMIDQTFYLKGAGTGGLDMAIAYKKDAEHLQFELPMALEQLEVERKGLEYVTPMMSTIVGTIVYYVLSVCWAEGI